MFLTMVVVLISVGVGYVLSGSNRGGGRGGSDYHVSTQIASLQESLATDTPTVTHVPTGTATSISTSTPASTDTPSLEFRVNHCNDVDALTPCVPYGTVIPQLMTKVPTPTPSSTPTPLSFCRLTDYKTDLDYVCIKPPETRQGQGGT